MRPLRETLQSPDAPTLGEILMWQATHRPHKRAFLHLERGEREAQSLTFAELHLRAQAIAHALRKNELGGQRVILAYPSGLEYVAVLFACFYAGVVAVPVPVASYGNSAARIRAIWSDAQAAAVLTVRSLIAGDAESPNEIAGRRLPDLLCIATDEIVAPGRISDGGVPLPPHVEPGGLAFLQYTSGSTGNPRGVMLSHSNLIHNLRALTQAVDSNDRDIIVNWLPLYHDMGLIGSVLHTVYAGSYCILMPPFSFIQNPIRWLRAITRYRASLSAAPCFAFGLCAQRYVAKHEPDLDLSSWRAVTCGGETIRPQMLEKFAETFRPVGFHRKALWPAYGLAEATLIATAAPLGTGLITASQPALAAGERGGKTNPGTRQHACCGRICGEQRVEIVDPESCHRLPAGQVGEIWLQGQSVAVGYWNRIEETRATFQVRLADEPDSGSWLRTGDLGFLSPDGLVVTGRRKETIKIHGANYDPLDLETVACDSHPSLSSGWTAAFSIDLDEGEAIVLVLERSAVSNLDVNLLVSKVVAAVYRQFGLTIYDLVLLAGRLPRTTSGKIQRNLSKELYLAGELGATPIQHSALGRCRVQAQEFA
jgi:acyl-CoA synthetase (AMP-forming)/AMP-acid ligase II